MGWFSHKKEAPPPPPPKEKSFIEMSSEEQKEHQNVIKKQLRDATRDMDRQIFHAEMDIKKAKKTLERAVKKNEDKNIQRLYAKNVLMAQKQKDRFLINKTKIDDVKFSIDDMFAQVKMAKTLGDCSGIMKKVTGLTNIAEIGKIAGELNMNMAKMGVVTEMVGDAMDEVGDVDIDEDSPDVNALLDEVTDKVNPNKNKGTELIGEKQNDFDAQLGELKF